MDEVPLCVDIAGVWHHPANFEVASESEAF